VPEWEEVEVEEGAGRYRVLPDGRKMYESRLTVSPAMMEQMWQGYRCASCLEDVSGLGAFPDVCPLCNFPIASLQRKRLEEDFVGEVERMKQEGWVEREEAFLEEEFFQPKPQIHVRRKP
jgi:hypothetical protein